MCSQPFVARTTTNPEQTCPLRDLPPLGVSFRGVLDKIAYRVPRSLDVGPPVRPVSKRVEFVEAESPRDPEDEMIVRSSSLGEFENPLIPESHPALSCHMLDTGNKATDMERLPNPIPTIREGRKQCLVATSSSFEKRSS